VGKNLDRVFRLAGKYYAASLTVWLVIAPFMIIGLLFTETTHSWEADKVIGIIAAGIVSHLSLGVVLWVAGEGSSLLDEHSQQAGAKCSSPMRWVD
jgi:hypothetical protein